MPLTSGFFSKNKKADEAPRAVGLWSSGRVLTPLKVLDFMYFPGDKMHTTGFQSICSNRRRPNIPHVDCSTSYFSLNASTKSAPVVILWNRATRSESRLYLSASSSSISSFALAVSFDLGL